MATVVTLSVLLSYVAVFNVDTHAEETNRTFTLISSRIGWDHIEEIVYNISGDSSVRYCYYSKFEFTNRNGLGDFYRLYIYSSDKVNVNVTKDGVADVNNGFRKIADEPFNISESLPIYRFSDKATCDKYLSGQMTDSELASAALNYNEVQESQREYDYDETYPYYDKASIAVNANSTATYNANMSQDMTNRYYELNAKIADKTGNSDDKHTRAYVEYYAAAIYADSSKLGVFNNYVLQYGNSVGSLSGTLPNGKKMDEIVKFDSNGRLCVSGYSGVEERGYKLICKEDTSSYLIAVEIDKITANDQVLCSPSFQRQLDADLKFTNSGSADGFLFGGTNSDSYTLIGYCTDIRINIVQGNKYTYSKDTYTYTWLNSAMRDRYGTKSTTYDNNSISTGENYEFDNNGNGYGGFEISDQTNMDSMKDYARTGFGLLGKDGYLALTAAALYQVPMFVWQCIGFVICVYGTFVLMKLLVKFL